MATSSGLFLATIYNQSQLAERKHAARYWLINTVATAVPLSAHPSPLVITTKLAAAILGGGVVRRRRSSGPVLPLWLRRLPRSTADKKKEQQRLLRLSDIRNISLIPDKELNIYIERTPSHAVIFVYRSYKI